MWFTYLGTGVGCTEKVADGSTSNGSRSTSSASLDRRDGSDWDLLLAEPGLYVGNDSRDEKSLGNHDEGMCTRPSVGEKVKL